ncbi:hypothetical protein B0T18DRAFT_410109 [Schizothecium vesticola]|uniref:Secreted protein n=1 Tax=Schizothecium vesticola TaxID=314040 RepID=A0AA40EUQ8_9PEZI|nr:hypothetical protein B0T18DRAFT_410109 [Schizothecium vesticola]
MLRKPVVVPLLVLGHGLQQVWATSCAACAAPATRSRARRACRHVRCDSQEAPRLCGCFPFDRNVGCLGHLRFIVGTISVRR